MVTKREGFIGNSKKIFMTSREFVILYRKIAMVFISVFLVTFGVAIQALCVFGVCFLSLLLQVYGTPFMDPALNDMEKRALANATITLYAGFYFIASKIFNF
jgi:hypothetical protein